jgi:hypothetical protein
MVVMERERVSPSYGGIFVALTGGVRSPLMMGPCIRAHEFGAATISPWRGGNLAFHAVCEAFVCS